MQSGAITEYIDVAQIVLYAFWIFFAGLIYYLHQENKREGYPLESNVPGRNRIVGFPGLPSPKTYWLPDGTSVTVPRSVDVAATPLAASPSGEFPGAPLMPAGAAMRAGVGPGAYAQRRNIPDVTIDGQARIVPLRVAADFDLASCDIDPRGLPVYGCDHISGGVVRDVWVDRSEVVVRYLEVEASPNPGGRGTVLLPVNFARIGKRRVMVDSILGGDFVGVPQTADPDTVTFLEEERVVAYYGAGTLYATADRAEPLL